jgi:hypothetical protein
MLRPGAPPLRSSPYPSILGHGLHAIASFQLKRWERALANVEGEQRRTLAELLAHSAKTEIGRRYGFGAMRSYEDFRERMPIGDYDSFSPYIERMRKGEGNLLVPEWVVYFGNSSGSSDAGRSKFLPITQRQIAETRKAGGDALFRYLAHSGDRELTRGFTLGLFHPMTMDKVGPVVITTNPVLMMEKTPLFTRPVTLPHRSTNNIADYDEKMTALAERYLDWDVRALTGTTCWFSVLLERVLEIAKKRYGRGVKTVSEVWPNLKVLFGGGVSAEPYMPLIRELVGHEVTLVDTYNATEGGIYAASDHSGRPGLPILPHRGTFFELVPVEAVDQPNPPRVPIWAAELDRPYAIVVTTCAGLFAYKLGDIVRFPSLDPLRIEFVGRLSGCLSITQELATHVDVEKAVAHATSTCPSTTIDFGAAAEIGVEGTAKSRYMLFVEFDKAPADLKAFCAAFDEGMRIANRVYGEHRGVALLEPRIVRLREGGARSFLQDVTRGNFQGKFPRILDSARAQRALAYAEESR